MEDDQVDLNADNRVAVSNIGDFPFGAIARITTTYPGLLGISVESTGTGVFLSPTHVLTAGHVAIPVANDPENPNEIQVSPAPLDTFIDAEIRDLPRSFNPDSTEDVRRGSDIALIQTEVPATLPSAPIGLALFLDPTRLLSSDPATGTEAVASAGYPVLRANVTPTTLFFSQQGQLTELRDLGRTDGFFVTDAGFDASGGWSGGPLIVSREGLNGETQAYTAGVITVQRVSEFFQTLDLLIPDQIFSIFDAQNGGILLREADFRQIIDILVADSPGLDLNLLPQQLIVGSDSTATQSGAENITGTALRDRIEGLGGNDVISGGASDDLLIGGAGDDRLFGGFGNDTYFYSQGDGGDTIVELESFSSTRNEDGGIDRLVLNGISPEDVRFLRFFSGSPSNDLFVAVRDPETGLERFIFIDDHFNRAAVEFATFDDGTPVDLVGGLTITGDDSFEGLAGTEQDDALFGQGGDDRLSGLAGNDTLIGGPGEDVLQGGLGNDAYLFSTGFIGGPESGADFISDSGGDADRIVVLDAGPDDVRIVRAINASTAPLSIFVDRGDGTEDRISIPTQFVDGIAIELLEYSDGTVADLTGGLTITGGQFSDALLGTEFDDAALGGAGNDTIRTGDGDDTLFGGAGNDMLQGGFGDDTYVFRPGFGTDRIDEAEGFSLSNGVFGGFDTILLDGFTFADITIEDTRPGAFDQIITVADPLSPGGEGFIMLPGQIDGDDKVEQIAFGNGTRLNLLAPNAASNSAPIALPKTFDSTGQAQLFSFEELLAGSSDADATDVLFVSDVTTGRGGTALLVDNGVLFTPDAGFSGFATYNYFLSDSVISVPVETTVRSPFNPTSGENTIVGSAEQETLIVLAGNDTVDAGGGDDLVDLGLGDDSADGGTGLDTLSFDSQEAPGFDFGGILFGAVVDLADQGTVQNTGQGMDTFTGFENLEGTDFNDGLFGDDNENTIEGGDGRDFLTGEAGNDTLFGGADFDVVDGGPGADVLYGGTTGGGAIETDIVAYFTSDGPLDFVFGSNFTELEAGTSAEIIDDVIGDDIEGVGGADGFSNMFDASNISTTTFFLGGRVSDTMFGGSGTDQLLGVAGDDVLYGNDGRDALIGEGGDDDLYGGAGDDFFFTDGVNEGNDTIHDLELGAGGDFIFFTGGNVTGFRLEDTDADMNGVTDTLLTYVVGGVDAGTITIIDHNAATVEAEAIIAGV